MSQSGMSCSSSMTHPRTLAYLVRRARRSGLSGARRNRWTDSARATAAHHAGRDPAGCGDARHGRLSDLPRDQGGSGDARYPGDLHDGARGFEHVVRGFTEGAIDYVTKPVHQQEVMARIAAHVNRNRLLHKAQKSIDACGKASATLDRSRQLHVASQRAREWLQAYCETGGPG